VLEDLGKEPRGTFDHVPGIYQTVLSQYGRRVGQKKLWPKRPHPTWLI